MAEIIGYKKLSRTNWGTTESGLSIEQLNCGAFLRIADAVEKMVLLYNDLIRDRDYQKQRAERLVKRLDTEQRRNAALRGHIKRIKRGA